MVSQKRSLISLLITTSNIGWVWVEMMAQMDKDEANLDI